MLNIKLGKYTITNDTSNFILGVEKEVEVVKDKIKTGVFKKQVEPIGYFGSITQVFSRYRKEVMFDPSISITDVNELLSLIYKIQVEDIEWCKENLKKCEV